ncbi:hypothetical protein HIM_05085 [Hirsutella minnesotensis 3608]|uniref:Uncharacterized protein n=1 Tax=Hirsutella minnesotensis 3608 TaxID=1043627 RepID=A0A0F8A0U3_9HYPO|nr:hypothetical protein HIM_05085 [Hirsutella minnesotensis 3608]
MALNRIDLVHGPDLSQREQRQGLRGSHVGNRREEQLACRGTAAADSGCTWPRGCWRGTAPGGGVPSMHAPTTPVCDSAAFIIALDIDTWSLSTSPNRHGSKPRLKRALSAVIGKLPSTTPRRRNLCRTVVAASPVCFSRCCPRPGPGDPTHALKSLEPLQPRIDQAGYVMQPTPPSTGEGSRLDAAAGRHSVSARVIWHASVSYLGRKVRETPSTLRRLECFWAELAGVGVEQWLLKDRTWSGRPASPISGTASKQSVQLCSRMSTRSNDIL